MSLGQPRLFFSLEIVVVFLGGGRSSVVRELEIKPEDPGFDRLAGQGEGQLVCPSESTLFYYYFLNFFLLLFSFHIQNKTRILTMKKKGN